MSPATYDRRELTECPACNGDGAEPVPGFDAEILCAWCDGRGQISQAVHAAWAEEEDARRRGGPLL